MVLSRSILNKAVSLSLMLCAMITITQAQETFSLQQAVDYALANKADVQKAYLDIKDAESQIKETRAIGMPKVTGTAGFQHFIQLPTSILPGTFNPQSQTRTLQDVSGNQFDLNVTDLDDNGAPIPGPEVEAEFGTKNNLDLGLRAEMLVFEGAYIVGLQTAKLYKEYANVQKDQVDYVVKENVIRAFYNLLMAYETQRVTQSNIDNLEAWKNDTEKLYEEGFAEKLDVDRIQFSLSNLNMTLANLEQVIATSKNLLKFSMGYPIADEIEIQGSVDESLNQAQGMLVAKPQEDFTNEQRPEYVTALKGIELSKMDIKRYKYSYFPSLAIFGQYNQTYQGNTLSDGQFFPQAFVGAQLSVPIYDGRDKRSKIERAEITLEKNTLDLGELEQSFQLDISNASSNLINANDAYKIAQENVDLSSDIYETTRIKYVEGVGSSIEVRQAESDKYASQNQLVESQLNLIQAKVDLDKALGLL